jgi:hypothetical protein
MYRAVLAALLVSAACVPAQGDYLLTPLCDDAHSLTLLPGSGFDLDMVLTSTDANVHDTAIFLVEFSHGGLEYQSYQWYGDYTAGGLDDESDPNLTDLSAGAITLDEDTLPGTGRVDVKLENLTEQGTVFAAGKLVTLSLHVPPDMPQQEITIEVVIDQFFDGQQLIAAAPGQPFTLTVIPEPACLALILPGVLLLRRRRRIAR